MSDTAHGAIFITGATSGLGLQAAHRLSQAGRDVVIGGRRRSAVDALVSEINSAGRGRASAFVADLSDLDSVGAALEATALPPLGGLFLNAGLTTMRDQRSAQGFELTFAVNVLAHQKLLLALAPRVEEGGRIVITSSGVHLPDMRMPRMFGVPAPRWTTALALARIDEAPEALRLPVGPIRYATSKLANVLQARAVQRWLSALSAGVDVFAIDPGLMVDTDFARELPRFAQVLYRALIRPLTPLVDNMRLSTTSAGHVLSLLNDPEWAGRGFAYLDGDHVRPPSEDAQRDDLMIDLWTTANDLVGGAPQSAVEAVAPAA